jgi:hypothetical protein
VPLLHIRFLFLEKHQNLNFLWYFKVPQANCLWVVLGKFGQILLHSQWLTICPNIGLKT